MWGGREGGDGLEGVIEKKGNSQGLTLVFGF